MKKVTGGGLPSKAWSQFMIAAHQGLSPAPLFGLGSGTATEPALEVDANPGADKSQETLFDMISHALGEDKPVRKPAGVVPDERPAKQVVVPPLDVDDVIRRQDRAENDGLVPPADIGETTGATQTRRKANSTLLDVLMGN